MKSWKLLVPCLFLAGCAAAPPPYPELSREGSAKLYVEDTTAFQWFFMPDGDKCGGYLKVSPQQNPFGRQDRTLLLEPNKRSAIQLVWAGTKTGLGACWVIVSFRLVPNGEYKLSSSYNGESCRVGISPLNSYSAEGFELRQMEWTGFKIPSECKIKSQ